MTTWCCIVHGVRFGVEGVAAGFPVECPVCMREELNRAKHSAETARMERNALLRAFEIKRDALIERVDGDPSTQK